MAANKFATMVQRNTNRFTLVLVYAVLEWTLIFLLLLNSLFSYLIIKFAEYVGLKPPCLWCSRVDHILDPSKSRNMIRDLLCEVHAAEISRLGYCSKHGKLVEYQDLCEDCLSSRPEIQAENVTFLPWIKELGMVQTDGDKVEVVNNEESMKCSCCGVEVEGSNKYSSYILIKPSWDVLEFSDEKANFITEVGQDDHLEQGCELEKQRSDLGTDQCENGHACGNKTERQMLSEFGDGIIVMEEEEVGSVSVSIPELKEMEGEESEKTMKVLEKEKELIVEESEKIEKKDQSVQVYLEDGESIGILPQHLEFFFDYTGNRLVPIDMIDSTTEEDQMAYSNKDEDQISEYDQETNLETLVKGEEQGKASGESTRTESVSEAAISGQRTEVPLKYAVLESMEMEEDESSWVFQAVESHLVREVFEQFEVTPPSPDTDDSQAMPVEEGEEKHSGITHDI